MIDAIAALARVKRIVEDGYAHPLYSEVTELAKVSKEIHADDSEDQKDQLRRYRAGEDEQLFSQRLRITNPATVAPLETCYSYLSQVWRTDGVKAKVSGDNRALTQLDQTFEAFYGRQSLHEYVFKVCERANIFDPNAWIVFERETMADATGRVTAFEIYPVVFPGVSALDWGFDRKGNTQYVVVKSMRTVYTGKTPHEVADFYVYAKTYYLHVAEVQAGADDPRQLENYQAAGIKPHGKDRSYVYASAELPGICPAIRLGAYPYKEHPEICELFAQSAVAALQDLMRDNNYLAVIKTVHVFPDRAEYVKPCRHENEQGECCDGGYYGGIHDHAHVCRACGGLGYAAVTSEQSVKRLVWPDNPDDMAELSKTVHYFERPIDIAQMYISETERITNLIVRTVMNQEIFERPSGSATATEIQVNYDRIYNKLMPFAEQVANVWEHAYVIGFAYLGAAGDAEMRYPADMKMMGINELLALLSDARASGAPVEVIDSLNADLIAKQYRTMPDYAKDMQAYQWWKPWRDKSEAQVAAIIGTRADTDFQRRLWENFTEVVAYLQRTLEPGTFAATQYDGQRIYIERALSEVTQGQESAVLPQSIDLLNV